MENPKELTPSCGLPCVDPPLCAAAASAPSAAPRARRRPRGGRCAKVPRGKAGARPKKMKNHGLVFSVVSVCLFRNMFFLFCAVVVVVVIFLCCMFLCGCCMLFVFLDV